MRDLIIIMPDQLNLSISSLSKLNKTSDLVVIIENIEHFTYVKHHKQKLVLIISAMRHFATLLADADYKVEYRDLEDPDSRIPLKETLLKLAIHYKPQRVIVTEPSEWWTYKLLKDLSAELKIPLLILEDDRFLCSREEFSNWASGKKELRMEYFYRMMRRKHNWLMQADKPVGGKWNFDRSNRKKLPSDIVIPEPLKFKLDATTKAVIKLVKEEFKDNIGNLENFNWAVTRQDALQELEYFTDHKLALFGDYQDALRMGEDKLFHSLLSPYLNLGLLLPSEVCETTLKAYKNGKAPLNAVEGFVRQILGWREFIKGVYWHFMPHYTETNYLNAKKNLPAFYWTGETDIYCLQQSLKNTLNNAYAHHIQRLMVTGNFALLAGIEPRQVEKWYLEVYADAFDWVELPNTHGMVLHADGGIVGSKPYAASGAYINRMSDYCKSCKFDPQQKFSEFACPFNYLYWNFLIKNRSILRTNLRMKLVYRILEKMTEEDTKSLMERAETFMKKLDM